MTKKKLIVKKYGGVCLSSPEKIQKLAQKIAKESKYKSQIIVVSAMGKTTDSLVALAKQVSQNPTQREMDMLLSVGERISMALMSMALNKIGCSAISLTGSQAGIITTNDHENANIKEIRPLRILQALRKYKVVIIAGFQGMSERKEITTLGRGGSDNTALALAAHFKCGCEILKDVDGIFSADPNIITKAKLIKKLNYDDLIDMTFWGAKALQSKSAEIAKKYKVPLWVGSANWPNRGTLISDDKSKFISKPDKLNTLIAVNSHSKVLSLVGFAPSIKMLLKNFDLELKKNNIGFPTILGQQGMDKNVFRVFFVPNSKDVDLLLRLENKKWFVEKNINVSVTATSRSTPSALMASNLLEILKKNRIIIIYSFVYKQSLTFILPQKKQHHAIKSIHSVFIETPSKN